jgi:hypothetical protein
MKTIKRSRTVEIWLQWYFWGLMLSAFGVILFGIAFGHLAIDILYRGSTGTFLDSILTGREDNPLEYYYTMIDRLLFVLGLLIFSFICFELYLWRKEREGTLTQDFILVWSIGIFLAITLVSGIKPLVRSILYWHKNTIGYDEDTLRRHFHNYYNRQYPIYKQIEATIPVEDPVLIDSEAEHRHFFAYYLAPRRVYHYSTALTTKLNEKNCAYHIVTVRSVATDSLEWAIVNVDAKRNGSADHQRSQSSLCR